MAAGTRRERARRELRRRVRCAIALRGLRPWLVFIRWRDRLGIGVADSWSTLRWAGEKKLAGPKPCDLDSFPTHTYIHPRVHTPPHTQREYQNLTWLKKKEQVCDPHKIYTLPQTRQPHEIHGQRASRGVHGGRRSVSEWRRRSVRGTVMGCRRHGEAGQTMGLWFHPFQCDHGVFAERAQRLARPRQASAHPDVLDSPSRSNP